MTTRWKDAKFVYTAVVICWLTYVGLSLLAPTNSRLHLSTTELLLLRLTVFLPIHLIWLLAAYGAVKFKHYAETIQGGPDAVGLNHIANGLFWTLAYSIVITLLGSLVPFIPHSASLTTLVIIRDHLPALITLITFALIYQGSHQLKRVANFTTWTNGTAWGMTAFALFSYVFVLEFATSPNAAIPGNPSSLSIVPHGVLLVTLIMPYLAAWFIGLLASINITKYARQVKGVLYRQALQRLVIGLLMVILFTMVYQVLVFSSRFLANISLGLALALVYGIIILYGLGFMFVALGAKKLIRIEAVE